MGEAFRYVRSAMSDYDASKAGRSQGKRPQHQAYLEEEPALRPSQEEAQQS